MNQIKQIILVFSTALWLAGCQVVSSTNSTSLPAWNKDHNIWLITDIHHLSPQLYDHGEAFQHIQSTAAGKDVQYSHERMEMLRYQIEQEKPAVLVVSGDLTLNGEYQSMVELQEHFAKIEQLGTKVFVIPGNHDISNGWASEFFKTETTPTKQVLASDFQELFSEFGYAEATSRDSSSLSYIAEIASDVWLLMIDSNQYAQTEGKGLPTTAGKIKDTTLRWIVQEIQRARQSGARLIPIVHHNSLVHVPMLATNFTLDNAAELQSVLQTSGIPVTFSGHIHAQHIVTQGSLTDIVTGSFSLFPAAIGEIRLSEEQLHYRQLRLNSRQWAMVSQQSNPDLIEHELYLKNIFEADSKRLMYKEMIEGGWYREENALVAVAFSELNRSFFSGQLAYEYDQIATQYEAEWQELNRHASARIKQYIEWLSSTQDQPMTEMVVTWTLSK